MPAIGPRSNRVAEAVLVVGWAFTVLIFFTGGFTVRPFGIRVALTSWPRALGVTLVIAAASAWLTRRNSTSVAASTGAGLLQTEKLAHTALAGLSLAGVMYWATYFVPYCGGSDSYGYVSASRALLEGALIQRQEIASWLPVVNPLDVATPAGWVPAADRSGIAPQYPLGLPVVMALAASAAGPIGPFWVPFLCGVVSLVVVHRIADAAYGDRAAWLAAALVSWNPLMVAYAKQPMSDVPATMWTLVAVWALLSPHPRVLMAGLATGAAFLTRPGGVGAYAVLAVAVLLIGGEGRWRRALRFAIGVAPFITVQALVQWRLFGHPLQSGYGSLEALYGGASIAENVGIFALAIWQSHTPLWVAAVAASWLLTTQTTTRLATAVFLGCAVPYLLYLPFDHWETLRFLLPGLVLLAIAAAGGVIAACTWIGRHVGGATAPAVLTVVFGAGSVFLHERFLRQQGTPDLRLAESRYPAVAERLRVMTPSDAVVFAAQHSGSIRYYAPRLTLRWDLLRREDLRPAIDALRARGHRVYIALEGAERERFSRDFDEPLRTTVSRVPLGEVRNIELWELMASLR